MMGWFGKPKPVEEQTVSTEVVFRDNLLSWNGTQGWIIIDMTQCYAVAQLPSGRPAINVGRYTYTPPISFDRAHKYWCSARNIEYRPISAEFPPL